MIKFSTGLYIAVDCWHAAFNREVLKKKLSYTQACTIYSVHPSQHEFGYGTLIWWVRLKMLMRHRGDSCVWFCYIQSEAHPPAMFQFNTSGWIWLKVVTDASTEHTELVVAVSAGLVVEEKGSSHFWLFLSANIDVILHSRTLYLYAL